MKEILNNKKLLENQLAVWRAIDRVVQNQERTLGIIEKILNLPKLILVGTILGLVIGIIATIGLKLWLQATPDGKLNSYVILLVFVAGLVVKELFNKIKSKNKPPITRTTKQVDV